MMPSRRALSALSLAAVVLAPATALAQGRFADAKVEATHVAGSVYMLTGVGGNIGVSSGTDGQLMIDDQFAELAPRIRVALEGIQTGADLQFVLNTHWHGDHTGGNHLFATDATIIAHENIRRRLAGDESIGGRVNEETPKGALPVITFDESLRIHFNGEAIEMIHFPKGHTDGDSIIFFKGSNVIHMGDHLFNGMFPFVDLDSGGTVTGYLANMEGVLAKLPAGVKLIAGHGPVGSAADLAASIDMIKKTSKIVRAAIAKGDSLEAIQKAGLGEEWASWSWSFIPTERWIETLYNSYKK